MQVSSPENSRGVRNRTLKEITGAWQRLRTDGCQHPFQFMVITDDARIGWVSSVNPIRGLSQALLRGLIDLGQAPEGVVHGWNGYSFADGCLTVLPTLKPSPGQFSEEGSKYLFVTEEPVNEAVLPEIIEYSPLYEVQLSSMDNQFFFPPPEPPAVIYHMRRLQR